MTVLVVEDEAKLAASLAQGFREEGFTAETVAMASTAIARVESGGLRAIILDLGLPDGDGQTVILEIRKRSEVPILVLTARDAIDQRITALDGGADDYLVKPFAFAELLARLRATLRRVEPTPRARVTAGDVLLVPGDPVVKIGERSVTLSPRERALVELLVDRLGTVVSRRDILREAFGYDFDPGTNIVEVHVGHVRRKLAGGRLNIETVRGYGYRAIEVA